MYVRRLSKMSQFKEILFVNFYVVKLCIDIIPKSAFLRPILFECSITFIQVKKHQDLQCYVRIGSPFSTKVNFLNYVTLEMRVQYV